jgi:nucleoside 2-deoxyribosyltransferase
LKIYLAGGMRTRVRVDDQGRTYDFNWQDVVKQFLKPEHEVLDPRDHNTKEFTEYSFLDVLRIRQCDVLIGYIEEEHPGPYGLAGEIAYAKGLGKTTLLINEKHEDRYIRFTENFADIVFHSFAAAMPVVSKI